MKNVLLIIMIILLNACGLGPAKPGAKPNALQRSKVLSKNEFSISIEHSTWGKTIAFETAAKHCEDYGKVAIYQGASQQYSPDVISTWICKSPE